MHPTGNPKIVDLLMEAGLLTPELREGVLNQFKRMGGRIEEAIMDVGNLDEGTLLKWLAQHYATRFVTTDKLAKADISRVTLEKVPRKLAESLGVFPVVFDGAKSALTVVSADPAESNLVQELQMGSGAKQVSVLVARPLAIKAAISKHYQGDIHAFANLDKEAHVQFTNMMDVFERNLVSEDSMVVALASENNKERVLTERELSGSPTRSMSDRGMASESYLETFNVLVSLLENQRPDLRGHSAHVARLMKKICERIGLNEYQIAAYCIAAYTHDLGKMSAYHLTSLNVAEFEGHRTAAGKSYKTPSRLLEAVKLPNDAIAALESMYERYDGTGIPGDYSGKDIPLGARLLAIVDTYADLTQNPRNPFRKILKPPQACEALARYKGTALDPNLVDLFKNSILGEDLKARLLANRHLALVIDPDPEETTVLELRMLEQGFEVQVARTSDEAWAALSKGDFHLVVSEVAIQPSNGLALLERARKERWGERLPWVFVSSVGGHSEAKQAFELGASDYVQKPVRVDVLVTKLRSLVERDHRDNRARGVSGSLSEMGLPEIIQVLWHGRKTGALRIRSRNDKGEFHFVDGAIYNALWGSHRGEDAVYAMLLCQEGEFSLDPNFKAPQQVIHASPEALLLEGMRRMDEASI